MTGHETALKLLKLGPNILSIPAAEDIKATSQPKGGIQSVVLLGWLEAATKHVLKYVPYYRKRYPNAQIIYIASTSADWTYTTIEVQVTRALPAVKALLANGNDAAAGGTSQGNGNLVVHAFSNGGAQSLCNLSTAYQRETGSVLPLRGVIFDSAPGKLRLGPSIQTIATLMPKNLVIQVVARLASFLIYTFVIVLSKLGWRDQIEAVRISLNRGALAKSSTNRLYMYSKADVQVHYQDVEAHARDAQALGMMVKTKCFQKSPHVGHLISYPEEYWQCIDEFLTEISNK